MIRLLVAAVAFVAATATSAREPVGLHEALQQLARQADFSGAVVIRDRRGLRFSRGYGPADPFTGRAFMPHTPVDSGSLAKPVTAAAVLLLAHDGTIDLDAPVRRYLPEYPHPQATVRHLLAHSAGLPLDESPESLAGKSNASLLANVAERRLDPLFPPGTAFNYCNLCAIALAELIERVTGRRYLEVAHEMARLPSGVTLRPQRLADWKGRAIGHRRAVDGRPEPFDSWEGEGFYGAANLSISADQLARWGTEWWRPPLRRVRPIAKTPAVIAGKGSGLTWGNWYCAPERRRCHYLGHHEGFHHMLYWDSRRQTSIAMVTNNALAPALQQRLQRALLAFTAGSPRRARAELQRRLPEMPVEPGSYILRGGERVSVATSEGRVSVIRGGIAYPAYPTGSGIRYIPGLDVYVAGAPGGRLHWLSLYEDMIGAAA